MKKNNIYAVLICIFLLMSVFLASCKVEEKPSNAIDEKKPVIDKKITKLESSQNIKKFSSAKDILEYIKSSQAYSGANYYGGTMYRRMSIGVAENMVVAQGAPAPMEKSAESSMSGVADTYSKTNVQVEGVDEADFVKNDDKYIYVITQNKLVIVEAYPAESGKIVSETELEGRPRNMFVNKDRLAVVVEEDAQVPMIQEYDFVPRPRYTTRTHVYVYDISDKSSPEKIKDYNINGNYFQSRMIGDHVYFVVNENVYYYGPLIDLPVIRQASSTVMSPEVFYFDNPEDNYNFNTVASFNIFEDSDEVSAKTFMMGYTNNMYVSQNNIYITYQKNYPYRYYEMHNEDRFFKIVVPLLPFDVQGKINDAKNDNSIDAHEKWDKISTVLEDMYNNMDKDEASKLIQKIEEKVSEYESQLEIDRRKTVIHKIRIENGNIDYQKRGEVPGYLLNQFSMDENGDYFRVATTMEFYGREPVIRVGVAVRGGAGSAPSGIATASVEISSISGNSVAEDTVSKEIDESETIKWTDEEVAKAKPIEFPRSSPSISPIESKYNMYNNVYILDKNMETIGKLEALAPDERIYSTRFLGDRLYMVTFKRVDPLFVIDLSDPQKPEVLGQLKIPGYSDYLHPYDENHIIGIGKETESNEWGGVSTRGVKLALFDVSDVSSPKELAKHEIGEQGTDSEALRDHKAFLFDKNKNLLVLPVTEVKSQPHYDSKLGYYKQRFWQGAYVFGLTPKDGFTVKGKITHNEGEEQQNWYWYGSPNAVSRSLYMDDVLYTVSLAKIKANDLSNIANELKEIKLPYEKEQYPYQIYYGREEVVSGSGSSGSAGAPTVVAEPESMEE